MDRLKQIVSEINQLKYDIRAEVLLNDLLQNKVLLPNQYWVSYQGQFTRSYRTDILEAKAIDFNFDKIPYLQVDISRDGLYDMLPESITHNAKNEKPDKGVETMMQEYKIRKQQEKSARRFFTPFENEFFSVGVNIEGFEYESFRKLNDSDMPELFYKLWDIPSYFPKYLASKFMRLLPYAYQIVGDIPLTTHILSELLGEKVTIKDNEYEQYTDLNLGVCLGNDITLGVNFIIGTNYEDYTKHLVLEIGPIENTSFMNYILDGKYLEFVRMYCEYFFPIEVETQIEILLSDEERYFQIREEFPTFLGYNTYI